MIEEVTSLISSTESLKAKILKLQTQHVNKQKDVECIKDFVKNYFSIQRPSILSKIHEESILQQIDVEMQNILRFTQSRTPKRHYRASFVHIKKELQNIEIEITNTLCIEQGKNEHFISEPQDERIFTVLSQMCPSAAASFGQGILDISDTKRISWRGTATEFREALREVLDKLAPDDEVEKQPGFKYEKDKTTPTMKQKAVFILKSRGQSRPIMTPTANAIDTVEEKFSALVRSVYQRSSVSVHTGLDKDEVNSVKKFVVLVLSELLQTG